MIGNILRIVDCENALVYQEALDLKVGSYYVYSSPAEKSWTETFGAVNPEITTLVGDLRQMQSLKLLLGGAAMITAFFLESVPLLTGATFFVALNWMERNCLLQIDHRVQQATQKAIECLKQAFTTVKEIGGCDVEIQCMPGQAAIRLDSTPFRTPKKPVTDLGRAIAELNRANKNYEDEIKILSDQMNKTHSNYQNALQKQMDKEKEVISLHEEVKQLKACLQKVRENPEEAHQFEKSRVNLEERLEEASKNELSLQQEISILRAELSEKQTTHSRLLEQMVEKDSQVEKKVEEIVELRKEVISLTRQLESGVQDVSALQVSIAILEEELATIQKEKEAFTDEIAALQAQIKAKDEQIEELNAQIAELLTQSGNNAATLEELRKGVEELKAAKDRMHEQATLLAGKEKEKDVTIEGLCNKMRNLALQAEAKDEETQQLRRNITELETCLEKNTKEKESLLEQNVRLERRLEESNQELADLRKTMVRQEDQLQARLEEVATFHGKIRDAESHLQLSNQEKATLHRESAAQLEQVKALELQVAESKKQAHEHMEEVQKWRTKYTSLQQELERLQAIQADQSLNILSLAETIEEPKQSSRAPTPTFGSEQASSVVPFGGVAIASTVIHAVANTVANKVGRRSGSKSPTLSDESSYGPAPMFFSTENPIRNSNEKTVGHPVAAATLNVQQTPGQKNQHRSSKKK